MMRHLPPIIAWLMEGDPAIQWQTRRDLLAQPARRWKLEQRQTLKTGWGAGLIALQDSDGRWGGGLYSPKWTSTTYTMLTLRHIGIPRDCRAAQLGARQVLDGMLGPTSNQEFRARLAACDRCIVGMILQIAVYFQIEDERIDLIAQNLIQERMPDGAWNCRRGRLPRPIHSSFHTTFNVLEGIREYIELSKGVWRADLLRAEQSALEFMLQHKLYRSHKTDQVVNEKFTFLSFPPRWHYDILRGLSYFARVNAPRDPRLQDAIAVLRSRQLKDGRWPVQQKYSGRIYFDMEKTGAPSRWNTLRALRVLRWWQDA